MQKAITLGRSYEASVFHMKKLADVHDNDIQDVHAIRKNDFNKNERGGNQNDRVCHNCGRKHKPKSCPVYSSQCHTCSKQNPWSKYCRNSNQDNPNENKSVSEPP